MVDSVKKRLHRQILAVVIPVIVLIAIICIPSVLQTDIAMTPLEFTATKQSGGDDVITLRGSFNRELLEREVLWLYAENAMIELTALDTQYRFNERGNTPAMFRSPGSGWYSFALPRIRMGETVELTVRSYYNESNRAAEIMLSKLYIGDGSGLLGLMLRQINFFSIVLIFALIAGVIYVTEGAIYVVLGMSSKGIPIVLCGLYCLTGGIWSVTDALYPYLTLFVSPAWVAALLDMSGLLLFPIVLAAMLRYYTRGKRARRMMTSILIAEIAVTAVCLLFQITGKVDLIEQQLIIGGVALVCLGLAMVCMVLEYCSYRDNYLLFLFLTVMPVFIAEILDGINVIWPFMSRRVLMQYSFGISILMLTLQLIGYANVELKKAETLFHMENEMLHSRISILLSQIQPHFLYNALNTIRYLCRTQPEKAADTITDFSSYLRGNMDFLTQEHLILFSQERKHIECYLNIEQARFPELNIVYDIKAEEFLLPPLTLQTLVENAVKHGATQRGEDDGTVVISTWEDDGAVYLKVEDDGAGFEPEQVKPDGQNHIGIGNARKRIQTMCNGTLIIESVPNKGTFATITIPKEAEM